MVSRSRDVANLIALLVKVDELANAVRPIAELVNDHEVELSVQQRINQQSYIRGMKQKLIKFLVDDQIKTSNLIMDLVAENEVCHSIIE